jgi:hypothetical protein
VLEPRPPGGRFGVGILRKGAVGFNRRGRAFPRRRPLHTDCATGGVGGEEPSGRAKVRSLVAPARVAISRVQRGFGGKCDEFLIWHWLCSSASRGRRVGGPGGGGRRPNHGARLVPTGGAVRPAVGRTARSPGATRFAARTPGRRASFFLRDRSTKAFLFPPPRPGDDNVAGLFFCAQRDVSLRPGRGRSCRAGEAGAAGKCTGRSGCFPS